MLENFPDIICGPFVRRVESDMSVLWLCTHNEVNPDVKLFAGDTALEFEQSWQQIRIGTRCFVHLGTLRPSSGHWPINTDIQYQLFDRDDQTQLSHTIEPLPGQSALNFRCADKLVNVIQGSCRKPEHKSPDAFAGIVKFVADGAPRPDYLIMAGDQVYADDVAAPMLIACQLLSEKLGLMTAQYPNAQYEKEDLDWSQCLDQRHHMLPKKQDQNMWQKFWHGDNIVSSRFHDNHLMALDEFFACYLLTWSSTVWKLVADEVESHINNLVNKAELAQADWQNLKGFISTLPQFESVLANTPSVMIFDDHDVTDDWNLSADWEHHIYGHDTTRLMIRDALLSYSIFQGWGNSPKRMEPVIEQIQEAQNFACDSLTELLLEFGHWHYEVETTPRIVVLDTRTHRWRSEDSLKNPSGLMDWERLEHLEKQLFKANNSILLVSAAPVFGVKSIEVVQSFCEMIGKELLVDVENWMAHKGAANKLMSSLRHDKAPDEVIILSGDVHYSFCFSAQRRFSSNTDKIWQLTCSGFKNEFPQKLLKFFDYIDRVLYSRYSLLNLFTKRRRMAIEHHPLFEPSKPNKKGKQRHLHSESAAGLVELCDTGLLQSFSLITAHGEKLTFDLEDED